ncbi:MAG: hypothetical protein IKP40_10015 [Clostridia bacterium]|nr:hypothetical protein [Clostridia bacterium]
MENTLPNITAAGPRICDLEIDNLRYVNHPGKALSELTQVIIHLSRLIDCCDDVDTDYSGVNCNMDLLDLLSRLEEIRNDEFGHLIDWETIACDLQASERNCDGITRGRHL